MLWPVFTVFAIDIKFMVENGSKTFYKLDDKGGYNGLDFRDEKKIKIDLKKQQQ